MDEYAFLQRLLACSVLFIIMSGNQRQPSQQPQQRQGQARLPGFSIHTFRLAPNLTVSCLRRNFTSATGING